MNEVLNVARNLDELEESDSPKLIGLWVFLAINAVIGILLVEFAFGKFKRHMEKDEERDKWFPQFRRYDAPNFSRLYFYPGAMTVLVPRLIAVMLILIFGLILTIPAWCLHN